MRSPLPFFALLLGCAHAELPPTAAAALARPADAWGTHIYTGIVTPAGADAPAFRYERRVHDNPDGTRVSTHVTWVGQGSREVPIVVQRATQDAQGSLLAYDEVHAQRGKAYHYDGGDRIVGPTLFEFVLRHLPQLRAGEVVPLRFWDRGSSYRFELRLAGDTVQMRARNPIIRRAIAPMQLRLGADDEIVAYHGRIPPLVDGHAVDAASTYEYFAAFR